MSRFVNAADMIRGLAPTEEIGDEVASILEKADVDIVARAASLDRHELEQEYIERNEEMLEYQQTLDLIARLCGKTADDFLASDLPYCEFIVMAVKERLAK